MCYYSIISYYYIIYKNIVNIYIVNIDRLSGHRIGHIDRNQFYLFLEQLAKDIREAGLAELEYELGGITTTYDALIDYFNQGIQDPERDRVYLQLVGHALQLSDRCTLAVYSTKEMPYYTSQHKTVRRESLHTYRLQLEAFAEGTRSITDGEALRQLATTHDKQLAALFTDLWTQGSWTAATAAEADALLLSPTITRADQCTIVSAVTLSLLRMFDPLKLLFLCDAYYHPEAMVSTRALVGIVIACYCWDNRINYYSEAKARLELLGEDPQFGDQVCEVILQFIRSTDTEEVDRKMREEIIPELMKNPKLRRMPNINIEEANADDINPDWEQWMHESGLEESMREITEWQMEGVDVNMSTFSQLKRYPFFYTISNWFRPFDAWQADMLGVIGTPGTSNVIADTILQSAYMCDSDKYSFCYAIREIPQIQREAMMSQLDEQNRALKESADMPDLKRLSRQTTQSILRQYVQNLYRFFKLFSNAQEFDNPFNHIVQGVTHSNPLYHLIIEPDRLFKLIGLNIKLKRYLHAIECFIHLEGHHPERMKATQLQQFGLCYQKMKMYDDAIDAYTKADLMKPDSYWTILHLAQCHRAIGNYGKALEYYETAETMKPDNLSLTYHVAELLYELGEYEEALPRLHKLDYHHPEALKSLRLLAECSFMSEQGAQATKYYERMMAEHTDGLTSTDWLHAAYNYWLQGWRDDCFHCMRRAEELHPQEPYDEELYAAPPAFTDVIYSGTRLLQSLGARKDELAYLHDAYYRTKRRG